MLSQPMECLFEREGLPRFRLPPTLAALYGGDFGLVRPGLCANFVGSVDGVVALPVAEESGAVISGHNEADRFLMGLLRAVADAVLVGAGTFHAGGGGRWWPEAAYPEGAADFSDLRARLGLRPHPLLVVATVSGNLDLGHAALDDSLILTGAQGEARLRGRLPEGGHAVLVETGMGGGRGWLELLRTRGCHTILCEGGPTLFGYLVEQGLVDELFLTTSPALLGRRASDGRKSLVEGTELTGRPLGLSSVRRHGEHLFLRYSLPAAPRAVAP